MPFESFSMGKCLGNSVQKPQNFHRENHLNATTIAIPLKLSREGFCFQMLPFILVKNYQHGCFTLFSSANNARNWHLALTVC